MSRLKIGLLALVTISVGADHWSGRVSADDQDKTQQVPKTVSGRTCPQYSWMNWGSYCSYYALAEGTCNPGSFDSTNCGLPPGDCKKGNGCVPAFVVGNRPPRTDDPGLDGYGDGVPGIGGEKRWKNLPGSQNNPWGGKPTRLHMRQFEDFEVRFEGPQGIELQAHVIVIKCKLLGTSGPPDTVGRALEVHKYPPRPPRKGTVSDVEPITDRPHAYRLTYTVNGTGEQVPIEIITHYETPGHT